MYAYIYEGWAFWIIFYLWFAVEIIFGMRARRLHRGQPKKQNKDRGSAFLIIFGMYVLIAIAIVLSMNRIGLIPLWTRYLGFTLMIIGMIVRFSAIYQLGRFFSPVVGVVSNQEIIQSGWYRLIRHPSYTGGWVTAIGTGLGLRTWWGALLCGVGLLLFYGYRIHIEERAMIHHFGDKYLNYMHSTKRMFPGIW